MPDQPTHNRRSTDQLAGHPTQDELVVQIEESAQSDSGPNETLRHSIEMFSKYGPVFKSLADTLIGALYVPVLLRFIAFQLRPAYDLSLLQGAVRRGLVTLCIPLFACLALARALRPGGLAERHFGWSPNLCDGLLKTLNAMIWLWLPLRFLYSVLSTLDDGKWHDSLGRFLFIAAMTGFLIGLWSTACSLRQWIVSSEESDRWGDALRSSLLWFMPVMPASLAILSAAGYHFTAVEMSWRAMWTVILMIGISMAGGLISRILLIAQFGIKLRQLTRNENGEINSDESIDITEIRTQVNRLLRATALVAMVIVGWQIWANVLPAINYLDEWRLPWSVISADGVRAPINLRHLLLAIGVIVITFILSRNLPGLLEITLLDRLPLDRGGRYAISFVVRYLVGIVGMLVACQLIGFSWNNVQWLAAGLTVGLGFGLQEIFANVISGIIILIERPVRVGDVVTVNGTTGTVTRMQLRATTIKDLDFRELIVPNKKFITENVMNWTLTDRRSRIILNIGVAYGSNTELVQKSLLKVASRHPLVQTEPKPDVFFKDFGESTLDFQLRVFIPSREIYAQVQHELNMAIEAEFKAKEIEIAFPQQDIFIKNLGDLPTHSPDSTRGKPGSGHSPFEPTGNPAKVTGAGRGGAVSSRQIVSPNMSDGADDSAVPVENEAPVPNESNPVDVVGESLRRVIPFPLKQIRGNKEVISWRKKKAS